MRFSYVNNVWFNASAISTLFVFFWRSDLQTTSLQEDEEEKDGEEEKEKDEEENCHMQSSPQAALQSPTSQLQSLLETLVFHFFQLFILAFWSLVNFPFVWYCYILMLLRIRGCLIKWRNFKWKSLDQRDFWQSSGIAGGGGAIFQIKTTWY